MIQDSGWLPPTPTPPLPKPLPRSASREERAAWSINRFLGEVVKGKQDGTTADPYIELSRVSQDCTGTLLSRDSDTATRLERFMTYLNHPRSTPPKLDLHHKTVVIVTADQSSTGRITTFTVAGNQESEIRDLVAIPVHPLGKQFNTHTLTQEACFRPYCRRDHIVGVGFNVRRLNPGRGTERLCPMFLAIEADETITEVTQGWSQDLDLPRDWLATLMITAYAMLAVALHQDTPRGRRPMELETATFRGRNIIKVAQSNDKNKDQNKMVGGLLAAWKGAPEDLRVCNWDTNLLMAINSAAETYNIEEVAFPNLPGPDRLVLFTNMERGYLFHSVEDGMDVESILFGRLHHVNDAGEVVNDLWAKQKPGQGEIMDACANPGCKAAHLIVITISFVDAYGLGRTGKAEVSYAPLALSTDQPNMHQYLDSIRDRSQGIHNLVIEAVGWLCCAVQFLAGKITRTSRHRATYKRQWRRNLETDPIPPPDEYQVVELRTVEYTNRPVKTGEDPVTVDWQVQWIVRLHSRRQWYPSERVHREILIFPYRKGPTDKPLVHVNKYFEVTR